MASQNTGKISGYLNSFKKKKVLIVGDVMIDSYMWGKATRISPEAPVPVVTVTNKDYRLGGAANVALNITALNATPYLCSVIGVDNYSLIFNELMKNNNLSTEGIISHESRNTTVKTRIICSDQHMLRVDEEIESDLSNEVSAQLYTRIEEIVKKYNIDVIIFEDYDKGVLTPELIEKIVALARKLNIITTVDPKKKNFNYYKNVDLFKPNFKEFTEGVKIDIYKNDIGKLTEYAKKFLKDTDNKNLMITLSEYGNFISDNSVSFHYPAMLRNIADVSGAGDTVISIASLLLSSGATIAEIAEISNIAGGLVCGKVGVIPVCAEELKDYFNEK
ncbi:MAG: PfkB family carbohydrate kinase [Bacteroidales bacterium]|jgi:rfaE bifunctional protein kinase chain/domain|nr:PfkB family carbohydrate kinase [Bacteroidales bacterium]